MTNAFFERPVLNSPYEIPTRHWELDKDGQPTGDEVPTRRLVKFFTPIPRPKKARGAKGQTTLSFDEAQRDPKGGQEYKTADTVAKARSPVEFWRRLPSQQ